MRFYDAVYGGRVGELVGHQLWCEAVAVLPDGRVVSGGGVHAQPGELKIWQAKGVRPFKGLENQSAALSCAAFRPDMKELATGDANGEIYLWDLSTWPPRGAIAHKVLKGHNTMVRSLIYADDGKTLISAADAGKVIFWDAQIGEEIRSFTATTKKLYGMALSPDGKLLVTTGGNWQQTTTGEAKVWDAATGKLLKELPGFQRHAWTPAFSPDGKLLAVSGGQNTVRLYDTATWAEKSRLAVTVGVRALAISPDGKTIATASETNSDPVVKLWDIDTGHERISLSGLKDLVFHLRFTPDGKTVMAACGDSRVLAWDVPPRLRRRPYTEITYSPLEETRHEMAPDKSRGADGRRALGRRGQQCGHHGGRARPQCPGRQDRRHAQRATQESRRHPGAQSRRR